MDTRFPPPSPRRDAVYNIGAFLLLALIALTTLHDERLLLDQQCSGYASARACRVH